MEAKQTIYNFSAGPSVLPKEILKKAQDELLDYKGCGVSVLEMSHRSKEYEAIIKKAEADLRQLVGIPQNYKVLFMQGGGSLQFACVCMNLLRGKDTANYLVTGEWSLKAYEEAKKYCKPHEVVPVTKGERITTIPDPSKWNVDPNGAYFYYCDNETITGVEFNFIPDVKDQILVCDMSSNFCSHPIDVSKYGLIFAGAQKNVGPSGVTIVIVREDLLDSRLPITPTMCDYSIAAKNGSMYNTPPTFTIYMCGLYFEYLIKTGGLSVWKELSEKKSRILYDFIEASNGFYISPIDKVYRSKMNLPFRIKNDEKLEEKFIAEARKHGFIELKGHRSVGGCRASFYNGMPVEGIEALRDFLKKFMEENQQN